MVSPVLEPDPNRAEPIHPVLYAIHIRTLLRWDELHSGTPNLALRELVMADHRPIYARARILLGGYVGQAAGSGLQDFNTMPERYQRISLPLLSSSEIRRCSKNAR